MQKLQIMNNDRQIQQDVIAQLQWDPAVNAANIGVSVRNGIVTLSGIVDTYAVKVAAEKAATKVLGVKALAEDIQVGQSPGVMKTDTEIAEAVFNELKWHGAIPDDRINIKVEDGVVSLKGTVEWQYQRNTVQKTIEGLVGVRKINNYISVKPITTPIEIKQKISAALQRSATVDAGNINIEVNGGEVVLKGTVRSMAEKEDAENAAWSAPGIYSIENKIEIAAQELIC